jgi:hypothetical protein
MALQMTNEEYIKILKQGVDVWNNWRKRENIFSPDNKLNLPNLNGADLNSTDLSGVNESISFLVEIDGDSPRSRPVRGGIRRRWPS